MNVLVNVDSVAIVLYKFKAAPKNSLLIIFQI